MGVSLMLCIWNANLLHIDKSLPACNPCRTLMTWTKIEHVMMLKLQNQQSLGPELLNTLNT